MTRATGIGSIPGTAVREAMTWVRDLCADSDGLGVPHLPETPARGPGADIIGRAAGMLTDLWVDLQPSGWRFTDRPGRDSRRIAGLWGEDLDEFAAVYDGYHGEVKTQVAGPWTLAASVELHRGERAVTDPGAAREIVESLADGVRTHVAALRRLVPGAEIILQLDEPSLPAVLAGRLPTASGFGMVRSVDPQIVAAGLRAVLAAHDGPTVVHCCAPDPPIPLLRSLAPGAIAVDVTQASPARWESLAATLEAGIDVYAGILPTGGTPQPAITGESPASLATSTAGAGAEPGAGAAAGVGVVRGAVRAIRDGLERADLPTDVLPRLTITPSCGLAGLTPQQAQRTYRSALDVARELTEESLR